MFVSSMRVLCKRVYVCVCGKAVVVLVSLTVHFGLLNTDSIFSFYYYFTPPTRSFFPTKPTRVKLAKLLALSLSRCSQCVGSSLTKQTVVHSGGELSQSVLR